ncbi:accessory gene regulator ArgB-like protein [Acetivibrio straminisolvens]|jgi:accessory gene regulator B|uniref:Accessory gene regulator B n=1 Tax=Acetivibrio straminisolvens JCM 21531 TaxID=1294263 RepID=W4V6T4_9FIRM|nr:accessory gene regulator B family protein [Acetivibrio straminisolvens]GAE88902.1 accessory gene regulator B [Acetivibrio straminisolvens JCM 21531]
MRFIHALSYRGADYLMKQMKGNHESRRIYYFGFQIIIGAVIKGLLLILLAAITRTILPSLTIVAVFVALRQIAGGYHMKTYGKCIAASLGMFIAAALISKYTYHFWNRTSLLIFVILTFIVSLILLLKWAPSDNPNRPITKQEEIKKFKGLSVLFIIIWLSVSLISVYFELNMYTLAGCFGVILEVFTITPVGHKFFRRLEQSMDRVKK